MAKVRIGNGQLVIELSGLEKLGAGRARDIAVPLSSIRSVKRLKDARSGVNGLRMPGTGIPGLLLLGTWRSFVTWRASSYKSKEFVAVSFKNPGYRVQLRGADFDALVFSSDPIAELEVMAEQ